MLTVPCGTHKQQSNQILALSGRFPSPPVPLLLSLVPILQKGNAFSTTDSAQLTCSLSFQPTASEVSSTLALLAQMWTHQSQESARDI